MKATGCEVDLTGNKGFTKYLLQVVNGLVSSAKFSQIDVQPQQVLLPAAQSFPATSTERASSSEPPPACFAFFLLQNFPCIRQTLGVRGCGCSR